MRTRASASRQAQNSARKHLRIVTDKLAGKVCELEELNIKLETEGAERERMVTESLLAHAEARHARDEAERANCAKDDFLAILSHELRTPLTPVLMCASALEHESSIEPELRAQLSMIRRNVQLEARLIDDLLDLTKIARGTLQLVGTGPIDVHSLLAQTREIVENDANQKSVQLDFDLVADEHHVRGDATRLHQVFWNLIKNAIKFSMHRVDELMSVPTIRRQANSFSRFGTRAQGSRHKHCLLFFVLSSREKAGKREPEALGLAWLFQKRSSRHTGERSWPRAAVQVSARSLRLN